MSLLPLISVNGIIGAQVSPLDRGFAYGDGVFETCQLVRGVIPLWQWHLERLQQGCARLMIPLDVTCLEEYLAALLASAPISEGVIKVTVSRGEGGRGYRLPEQTSPTYCVGIYPAAAQSNNQRGVAVRICQQRLAASPALAGIKHLNRLEQILARAEWQDDRFAEGILLDDNGDVIEATASNIFVVHQGALITPDLSRCGVAGVMRRIIMEQLLSRLDMSARVEKITLRDLAAADEIFLCNSVFGIWPVLQVVSDQVTGYSHGVVTQRVSQVLDLFLQERCLDFKAGPSIKSNMDVNKTI